MDKYLKAQQEEGKPKVYSVRSVAQFVELSTWFSLDDKVIFRGQAENWPLIPFVGRNRVGSSVLWHEKGIFDEFVRQAVPYLNIDLGNDWQRLALAQHNGLPTRLLDWTENPLVALWFAVKDVSSEKNKDKPRIVWAYLYNDKKICEELSPFSIDRSYIYFPEHVFPYIQAQSGLFTVHHKVGENPGVFPSLEEVENGNLLLSKIEIEPGFVTIIRAHLDRLGIHFATMFPGLEGIAKRIRYKYELDEDEIIS